jgi:cysteine sulfinate desulfinase/cysteine desulfurase-like protein
MDQASATPVKREVVETILPYFDQHFGNPSTVYDMGSEFKKVIEEQREKVARLVGAVEGEALVYMLAQHGIYANTGSACASKALKTSPVLVAIGVPPELAQGSIVFKMNSTNTMEDAGHVLDKLPFVVGKLRDLSPLWRENKAA